jgi:hypothetical protein
MILKYLAFGYIGTIIVNEGKYKVYFRIKG